MTKKDIRDMTISELFDLTGKVVVVTGAAKGIGLAIATRLAEAGASLLAVDIDADALAAECDAINTRGGTAKLHVADVSTAEGAVGSVAAAKGAYGQIDVLVNNAGIYPMVPALDLSEEIWDKTLNLNLKGAFFAAQSAAKEMVQSGRGGSIINVASIDGIKPTGNLVHYDSSKGGLNMMTKALAKDLGPKGVRVNSIAPGGVVTPGTAQAAPTEFPAGVDPEEMMKQIVAHLPLQRMGEPDDVARLALFLASPASAYMTGSVVVVDGGMLIA